MKNSNFENFERALNWTSGSMPLRQKIKPYKTASAIHASEPRFHDEGGLLVGEILRLDRSCVTSHPRSCACVKLWVRIACVQISVFCLKFIS